MDMIKLKERLKEISLINNRNRILKNYYSKELRKGKTYRASFMDKILLYCLVFLFTMTILIFKSGKFLLSLFISLILLYFIIIIYSYLQKKSKEKKIIEVNEKLKEKKLIREFSSLNKEGFTKYISLLFQDYYNTEVEDTQLPLDLKFTKDGDVFGVKCLKASMEDRIGSREVEIFKRELRERGISEGILITNTYFADGLIDDNLLLLDFYDIIKILKETGKYPTDENIESYIFDRFMDKRNGVKRRVKDFNTFKIVKLYILSIVFYVLAYFIGFSKYYKIMAVLVFTLASMISAHKITEYIRLKKSLNIEK